VLDEYHALDRYNVKALCSEKTTTDKASTGQGSAERKEALQEKEAKDDAASGKTITQEAVSDSGGA
jgi:hypothetical protein